MDLTINSTVVRLGNVLSPMGFRRKNMLFFRDSGDVVQLVQLQKSLATTKQKLVFTANLGVHSRTLCELQEVPLDLSYWSNWHWNKRIGYCLPEPYDKWWEATDEAAVQAASEDACEAIAQYGLVQIEPLNSTKALLDLWESNQSPGLDNSQRGEYVRLLRAEGL